MGKDRKKKKKRNKTKEVDVDGREEKKQRLGVEGTVQVSLDIENIQSGSSWGNVFAAAASVPLEELDDDFLQRTQTGKVDEGLSRISKLADHTKSNEVQKDHAELPDKGVSTVPAAEHRADEDDEDVESDGLEGSLVQSEPCLEGRMVDHPTKDGETLMILVDTKKGVVYSMNRDEKGQLTELGKLKETTIQWEEGRFDRKVDKRDFPFPTDPDDHCESPLEAYRHIVPLLQKLFPSKSDCRIYDPYFCNGAVERNLADLGFPRVHNVLEDCYKVWSSGVDYPQFDVLITNPPYSGDHIPKLLRYITSSSTFGARPWFLLLPTWVHKKDYYKQLVKVPVFYIVPKKRYVYLPPKEFRAKKASDVHKKSSPFVSMWYCWGGTEQENARLIEHYWQQSTSTTAPCDLARSKSALRDLRRRASKGNQSS